MRKFIQLFTVAIIAFSASILSADIKPAVIYDMGGKFDKSFNESEIGRASCRERV